MKKIFLTLAILFATNLVHAQDVDYILNGDELHPHGYAPIESRGGRTMSGSLVFEPALKPFYHGVASGDPTSSSVILWTRVTPDTDMEIQGIWKVYSDTELLNLVKEGSFTTNVESDYTVNVDVEGLSPATTYYYQFEALEAKSIIGRTRTTPLNTDHLRIAVVSCVNYQWGYFNALERIAERKDLDAVIHLGDYLYEYASDYYNHPNLADRGHNPDKEIVSLADYRIRYSQYRLDPMMRKFHQQHPIIATWDDHESTNDSWSGGAQNHQPENEGDWNERVDNSITAYQEWMPIRHPNPDNKRAIYRKINYGNLLDLIMLETRLGGREEPLAPKGTDNPEIDTLKWLDPNRTMLGSEQFNWLASSLLSSTAKWKILGSSIMMVPIPPDLITNLDAWDGYPVEREKIFGLIESNNIKNVGVISGDFHMSFASNLISVQGSGIVDFVTQGRSAGFEFTTPSISSANLNELESLTVPGLGNINPLAMNLPERSPIAIGLEDQAVNSVPWLHFMNSDQHGYLVLDIKNDKIQSDWFYSKVLEIDKNEAYSSGFFVNDGDPIVKKANEMALEKINAPDLAPDLILSVEDNNSNIAFVGCYPNPATELIIVNFALDKPSEVRIIITDIIGNQVGIIHQGTLDAGNHGIPYELANLNSGSYIVLIEQNNLRYSRKISVIK